VKKKAPCVYLLASDSGTLYTGVTANLAGRVAQHKAGKYSSFTAKYRCHKLVWYESKDDMVSAIQREKQIKGWLRKRKIELIVAENPGWRDLSLDWD